MKTVCENIIPTKEGKNPAIFEINSPPKVRTNPAKFEINSPPKVRTNPAKFEINTPCKKKVTLDFEGGDITSDGGLFILQAADKQLELTDSIAKCIADARQQGKVKHDVREMLRQRIYQIACGYEDVNDSDSLRANPAFKIVNGQCPENGNDLASSSTLCRFENRITQKELLQISKELVRLFVRSHRENPPEKIILDVDATDDPTHGQQFFSFITAISRHTASSHS